ncbi:MAG: hypothetical protein KKD18_00815 [Nanoarchaeota archaeon]|nr:hypothetical protein [Nanoarchaeota archaeon]MBU0976939.1 hypothetical protein [Nanoarchaeota archaeon]
MKIKPERSANCSAEILEFLLAKKLSPQEKIVALKTAAACLDEMIRTECKLEMIKETMINFRKELLS